jgi:hypothetical protein
MQTEFWRENLNDGDRLVDLSIDGRIQLKQMFKRWERTVETRLIWPRIGPV